MGRQRAARAAQHRGGVAGDRGPPRAPYGHAKWHNCGLDVGGDFPILAQLTFLCASAISGGAALNGCPIGQTDAAILVASKVVSHTRGTNRERTIRGTVRGENRPGETLLW